MNLKHKDTCSRAARYPYVCKVAWYQIYRFDAGRYCIALYPRCFTSEYYGVIMIF